MSLEFLDTRGKPENVSSTLQNFFLLSDCPSIILQLPLHHETTMQSFKSILSRRYFIGMVAQSFGALAMARQQVPSRTEGSFRVGFGSCLRNSKNSPILDKIVESDPDLFVWLGDNIYGDTEDMALLAQKYSTLGGNPRFQRLWKHCPNLSIWDDHDYGANNAGQEYPKKKESREIFLDFWQVPDTDLRRSHEGIYGSYTFGKGSQTVQIILLDGRSFRTTQKSSPNSTMLGEEQWKWLETELLKPASLKIICSGIQVIAHEHGYECWNELPHERQRMLDLIKDLRVPGVIFVSGDQHWAEISKLDAALGYPAYDFTASSLDQSWPLPRNSLRVGRASEYASFGVIQVDWVADLLRFQIINAQGNMIENHGVRLSSLSY